MCKEPPDMKRLKDILCEARINLFESWVPTGHRKQSALILAAALRQGGYNEEEALEIVSYWNWNNDIGFSEKALEKRVIEAVFKAPDGYDFGCDSVVWYCPYDRNTGECEDYQKTSKVRENERPVPKNRNSCRDNRAIR